MMRLLRPPRSGIFLRSFRLHSAYYARETIAKICSLWVALATAIISQTGPHARTFRTAALDNAVCPRVDFRASSRGCLAQLVEHRLYTARVGGSIPSAPTNSGVVVQLVRIPACHA